MKLKRPVPPMVFRTPGVEGGFITAPEVADWLRDTFIEINSPLYNPDHIHLQHAEIGVVWTNVPASFHGFQVVGTAEYVMLMCRGRPWSKQRQQHLLEQWEVDYCDFLITLYAPYLHEADDATFCAVIDHELYHCGQQKRQGFPRFRKDGHPMYAIVGHDVEEFVGIVRRYGTGPAAGETEQLVAAARKSPEVAPADIASMCGTCRKRKVA